MMFEFLPPYTKTPRIQSCFLQGYTYTLNTGCPKLVDSPRKRRPNPRSQELGAGYGVCRCSGMAAQQRSSRGASILGFRDQTSHWFPS